MKKTLVLAAVVVMLAMTTTVTVFAGYTWCITDPNIQLPGNRGVAHLIVAVPKEFRDTPVTVEVWAPAGSRVVGHPNHPVTVVLHAESGNPVNQIVAQTAAGFPIQLSVKYRGDQLGIFEFMDGAGIASWILP